MMHPADHQIGIDPFAIRRTRSGAESVGMPSRMSAVWSSAQAAIRAAVAPGLTREITVVCHEGTACD